MKTTLKLGSLLLLLGGSVVTAFGADNTTAIEYFKFLQFGPAKEILLQNQNDAEACFYFGEFYYKTSGGTEVIIRGQKTQDYFMKPSTNFFKTYGVGI